jgi:DNA-binding PadR family transcriptional regulator
MKEEIKQFLPLSPAALHILLALAGEDLHGYGIMLEVARQSVGQYKLGPGTLYDNLEKRWSKAWSKSLAKGPSPRIPGGATTS